MTTVRLLAASAALAAGATLASGPAPAAAAAAKACRPKGAVTLAATKVVRVFRVRARYSDKVYACRVATGRRTFLANHIDQDVAGETVGNVRVAGDFVAFSSTVFAREGVTSRAAVADTRARRIVRSVDVGAPPESSGAATDAVLTTRGTAAFAFHVWERDPAAKRVRIVALDGPARDSSRVLDEGADIDPESLELQGGTAVWRRFGPSSSAPFG